uniref:Integrase catalytic domain-containing protein n=1 Tax=Schizaphis graminum TaxID=13262 RepID=A0A2S2PTX9_SCHGA
MQSGQSNELAVYTIRRGQLKAQLTKFQTYINNVVVDKNIMQIRIRLEKIKELWTEFDIVQNKIETLDTSNEQSEHRDTFVDLYFDIVAKAETMVQSSSLVYDTNRLSVPDGHAQVAGPVIKMKPLELPTFSGKFEEWSTFKDLFSSMVHVNPTIVDVQKFVYLRMYLCGDALALIQNLATTGDNYSIAWNTVVERYDNKRILIQSYTKNIYELEPIQKESSACLRKFTADLNMNMQALKALGHDPYSWGALLLHVILVKLDYNTIRNWESVATKDTLPAIDKLITFLNERCQILEAVDTSKNLSNKSNTSTQSKQSYRNQHDKNIQYKFNKKVNAFVTTSRLACYFCKQSHPIYKCQKFIALNANARALKVDELNLCRNCLGMGHTDTQLCKSKRVCSKCDKAHNTLLHGETPQVIQSPSTENEANSELVVNHAARGQTRAQVLLATAEVHILNACGELVVCRALLDNGSQINILTEAMAQRLGLVKTKINKSITGINEVLSHAAYQVTASIKSRINNYSTTMDMLVLPKITGKLPTNNIDTQKWSLPKDIELADSRFFKPDKIDLLIGAESYWEIMCPRNFKLNTMGPYLQQTMFGWIIVGPVNEFSLKNNSTACLAATSEDNYSNLEKDIEKFWKIEECPSTNMDETSEDAMCRKHFLDNVSIDVTGKFVVKLPFRDNVDKLGESYNIALRRFLSLERRLSKNPEQYSQYKSFMKEYEHLGHMERVDEDNDLSIKTYYMPHTCVLNDSSRSTKLRVVFDGSCKSETGLSLNDVLLKGPILQEELTLIVARFRTHKYAFSADIKKMYRQVWVDTADQDYQRILWRSDPNEPIKKYRLCTVTYGTVPASFLSVACLHKSADINKVRPEIAQIIKTDFCVDDCLTGASTLSEALNLRNELITCLSNNGFELSKWTANHADLLKNIPVPNKKALYSLNMETEAIKTLGLYWESNLDCFIYKVSLPIAEHKITKRGVLSNIARLFDPLGLLGPVIVIAKILMQQLWKLKINWDDELSTEMQMKWKKYLKGLDQCNNLTIPRWLQCDNTVNIYVHGFADASCKAYGACLYVVCTRTDGSRHSQLVCAKSRIAPINIITIPRLELCAAVLLSKLIQKIVPALRINVTNIYCWSDSKVVLAWIAADATRWKPFVANRVSKVHNLTSRRSWLYVNTKENPADVLSRGCDVQDIQKCTLWWNGPAWLTDEHTSWEALYQIHEDEEILCEERKQSNPIVMVAEVKKNYFIQLCEKYSKLSRFQRVFAYVVRYAHNISIKLKSKEKYSGSLSVDEIQNSEKIFIKLLQNQFFGEELNNKKLQSLNPFFDNDNILRVGGRLGNATDLTHDHRHPIMIPYACHFDTLIFRNEHEMSLHAGPQAMLANVRLKYWPINGRRTARKIAHQCVACFKNKPNILEPIMGILPKPRVNRPLRCFETTGVDYAGPILMKTHARRNAQLQKAYICIFICFASKAVHIELVCDLTTDAFIAALHRFISRRGKCRTIFSDNGTNFVGANKKLNDLSTLLLSAQHKARVQDALALQEITWKFIPPRSPHFGGLWEAAVKAVKKHLNRTIANSHLTYDELYTVLTQIECCLNSRPLIPLSEDPMDLNVLTPAHFLIGSSLRALPEPDVGNVPINRLSRWQRVQHLVQHVWARWSKEYLGQLQGRNKWSKSRGPSIQPGMLVLIKENNLPPLKWLLGRVTDVHPGPDGVVRVATVYTNLGSKRRAVRLLCPLPVET